MRDSWEEPLQVRYAELLARRGASGAPPAVELEEIRALAETGADTPERVALLDRVLADPRLRDEYLCLREVVQAERRPARARRWAALSLAVAASLALVMGTGVLWRARRPAPEPMRGDARFIEVIGPEAGAVLAPGVTFAWRPVAGARAYQIEIADDAGNPLVSRRLADTSFALPADVAVPHAGLVWWVTIELSSGERFRSRPRPLRGP